MIDGIIKRSWAEVDLGIIRSNCEIYRSQLNEGQKIMAVVKADAYGHGDVEVARCLMDCGVENYAVSNIMEALRLRENGIRGQILILGYTPVDCAEELYKNDITQGLISEEYAEELSKQGYKVKSHFIIDTGMNRVGLDADDPEMCEKVIRKYSSKFELTGIFTHLCVADTDTDSARIFTNGQIEKFKAVADRIRDLELPFVHYMNSAGGLWYNICGEMSRETLARLGIILYGLKPDYSNTLLDGIRPAMKWKTVVSMVKTVRKDEAIGYGRTFRATRDMTVATLPTGYADGYSRRLSNVGKVCIHGKLVPIVGRICMDQLMVDVSDIPDVSFGDEVELMGDMYTADDMANDIGTIGYELVCAISKRVPRKYF